MLLHEGRAVSVLRSDRAGATQVFAVNMQVPQPSQEFLN